MSRALLVVWIGLLMASRIDLLGGEGPLVLTPFLVLSPIILGVEITRWWMARDALSFPAGTAPYLLTTTALFIVLLGSTFLSYELAVSARRLALLAAQAYMVLLVTLFIANRPDPERIVLQGAYLGLAATAFLNLLQAVVFVTDPAWADAASVVVDLEPGRYFGVIPRLTGVSHDPNHGGLFAVFLVWLVAYLAPPSRSRTAFLALGIASIVFTLSRSAVLAGLTLWVATRLAGREPRLTPRVVGFATAAVVTVTATYLAFPHLVEPFGDVAGMLANRLSLEEGSGGEHARLVTLGWEVGTESLRTLAVGVGYGNAFVFTQDIFPGNDYGNFHSLFLTLFAESGVLAAALGLLLFLQALRTGGHLRPMVLALLVFNLFQQAHTEPILWLILLLAWAPFLRAEAGQPTTPPEAYDASASSPLPAS